MKSTFILFLALALLCSAAGCASSGPEPSGTDSTPTAQSTALPSSATEPAFQELTVVDNDQCLIKITGIDPENTWGYTLNVLLENRTGSTTLMFSISSAAINTVQADPMFASEVAPGKKAIDEISFPDSFSAGEDIGIYTDIALNFRVYDSNDWSADPVATPSIHFYPQGKENASAYTRPTRQEDQLIADNDRVTVLVTGYRYDELWGYTADLFLLNKSDAPIMFSASEASVNGFMAEPFYAESLAPGNCSFSSIHWADSVLEDIGVSQVETIEFTLRVYREDQPLSDDLIKQRITLKPPSIA